MTTTNSRFRTIVFYAPTANAIGGGETWVNVMAHAFVAAGFQVRVIARTRPVNPVEMHWPDGVTPEFLGGPVPSSGSLARGSGRKTALRYARAGARWIADHVLLGWRPRVLNTDRLSELQRQRLLNFLCEGDISRTLVICVDLHTGADLALFAEQQGHDSIPVFVVQHHNSFRSLNSGQVRQFRRIARSAISVVALTEEDARQFKDEGHVSPATWASNPSPPVDWAAVGIPRDHVVVTMSRLTRQKQLDHAIRAWAAIADKRDWRLQIYGDGPERSSLQSLVRRLEVEDTIQFMGRTDAPELVFRRVALLLLSSDFEGWGLVIGEAAAQGTPTIAYDCAPGVRAQIDDGVSGGLVKRGDVVELARELEEFIRDEGLRRRLARGAAQRAKEFSLQATVARWELLLNQWDIGTHR